MLVSFFYECSNYKKNLSQTLATAVFTDLKEQFPALLFREIKIVASCF